MVEIVATTGNNTTKQVIDFGINQPRIAKAFKTFHGRHHNNFDKYDVSLFKITLEIFDAT